LPEQRYLNRRWLIVASLALLPALAGCTGVDTAQREYIAGVDAFVKHDLSEADHHLNRSIELCANAPNKQQQLSDSLLFLARVYSEQGRFASAEQQLKRALAIIEQLYGPESRQTATALVELAACHHTQGEYLQAEPLCLRALSIEHKVLPAHDLLVAATANNLAEIYQKLEKDAQAERYFEMALNAYRSSSTERARRGVIAELNNLAMFYKHENKLDEARRQAEEALKLCEESGPSFEDQRAKTLNTLAALDRAEFDFSAAESNYGQAIAAAEASKAAHEILCETLDNYADMIMADQHNFAGAEPIYLKAIEHCKHVHGAMHPMVAERMNDLADVYRHTGRYEQAAALLEQVLAVDRVAFEADSPITIDSMNNLSDVYLKLGKYQQAQRVYADWLPKLEEVLGTDHPHVADALENWALVAQRSADGQQAQSLRRRAREIRLKLMQQTKV
jgi:tetratricopeptide (TPR) repeat protein